jgi:endonuclease-3 related protein
MSSPLSEAYERLLARYGPQSWWPGQTPFEIMVGAVLVQNTNWRNVERAIENLREEGLLSPTALYDAAAADLEELIRPAGYYRVKAKRLRNLLTWLHERYNGSLEQMFACPLDSLRNELLAISGIGPETADSILLYAGGLPVFVVDAYAHRVLARHGWIDAEADYYRIQELFLESLPLDAALFNEYHALLVRVGKEHCKPTPICEECPLCEMLPEGGPISRAEY